jgi:GDP-D-mannose 3',5'-epimerase
MRNNMKKALVLGGGGFIGTHIVNKLKSEDFWVRVVDIKSSQFNTSNADDFILGDLTVDDVVKKALDKPFDEIYQLAADMGGAGYIFTGDNDANVMTNSALINLLVCKNVLKHGCGSIFYSSSACAYPEYNQLDPNNPKCSEDSAYPAAPDSEYGWEKLFSERVYAAYKKNYQLNCHVARYHNVYGPEGTYNNGKEKAPAALCRKVIESQDNGTIDIWGTGSQTRSFLYIDDCVEATLKLTRSDFAGPVNIGSEEMISINDFAKMIIKISGKNININNISGPVGVNGRNSDNKLIKEKLNWEPKISLQDGITRTYEWIYNQINKSK